MTARACFCSSAQNTSTSAPPASAPRLAAQDDTPARPPPRLPIAAAPTAVLASTLRLQMQEAAKRIKFAALGSTLARVPLQLATENAQRVLRTQPR